MALNPAPATSESLMLLAGENQRVIAAVAAESSDSLQSAVDLLGQARRVFILGAGRSGLALRMTAMRLMHLGLDVHVVGEVTTPAIAQGDVLFTASGSGTTTGIVRAATTAAEAGAKIVGITTDPSSPLAGLADVTILIPAAQKQDHRGALSAQYAGSLFEQALVILGDALFHTMWQASGATAEELWPRHANLE